MAASAVAHSSMTPRLPRAEQDVGNTNLDSLDTVQSRLSQAAGVLKVFVALYQRAVDEDFDVDVADAIVLDALLGLETLLSQAGKAAEEISFAKQPVASSLALCQQSDDLS